MDLLASVQSLSVLYACYYIYFFVYVVLVITFELTSFYNGLSFIIIPFFLYGIVKFFALPRPSKSDVEEILGVDTWQLYKEQCSMGTTVPNLGTDVIFKTIAHRGAGLDAPENSKSAIKRCHQMGCMFVEIDLSLTRDGVPVVFHDVSLDRMIGFPGNIHDYLWDELRKFNLIFRPDNFEKKPVHAEKIALFNDVIDLCVSLGIRLFIDVKDRTERVIQVIHETYQRHPTLYTKSVVTSFNPFIIYKIRQKDPKIVCSMAWRPFYYSRKSYDPIRGSEKRNQTVMRHLGALVLDNIYEWLFFHIIFHIVGLSAVLIHKDALSPGLVATWQNQDIRVIAWTVNSRAEKDFIANVLHIPYMTDSLDYSHI